MNYLTPLFGQRLTFVTFVMDYFQLGFDGPSLTLLIDPIVIGPSLRVDSQTPGYRDALCNQITRTVVSAEIVEDAQLTIEFDNDIKFVVPLASENYPGPEAIIFGDGEEGWCVW